MLLFLTLIDDPSVRDHFEQIYINYNQSMFSAANSILHNNSAAEDIVHDVFLNIVEHHLQLVLELDKPVRLYAYLMTAARNTALNYLKSPKNNNLRLDEYEDPDSAYTPSDDDNFTEKLCDNAGYQSLLNSILSLKPIYRDVLYQHFVAGLSVADTAKALNISIDAAKKRIARGKKLLLSMLTKNKE